MGVVGLMGTTKDHAQEAEIEMAERGLSAAFHSSYGSNSQLWLWPCILSYDPHRIASGHQPHLNLAAPTAMCFQRRLTFPWNQSESNGWGR